jgi:hypothetical protein
VSGSCPIGSVRFAGDPVAFVLVVPCPGTVGDEDRGYSEFEGSTGVTVEQLHRERPQ